MRDHLLRFLTKTKEPKHVKSQAMTPLIWLCSIIGPIGIAGMMWSESLWVQIVCAGFVGIVLLATLYAYSHWSKVDPDRLGSERFIMQSWVYEAAVESKDPNIIANTMLELIKDPHPPQKQLSDGRHPDGDK